MKIEGFKDIDLSIDKVTQLFADPAHLGEYQDGFIKKELINGTAGSDGAISEMYYKQGGRDMKITETITANRLPASFEAFYHHVHMDNTMKCSFTDLGNNRTRYNYEIEYIRINWVMPKLMSILFPKMFRNQVEKWMKQFKEFAEQEG